MHLLATVALHLHLASYGITMSWQTNILKMHLIFSCLEYIPLFPITYKKLREKINNQALSIVIFMNSEFEHEDSGWIVSNKADLKCSSN